MRSIPNGWRVAALLVIAWFAVTMAACTDAVPQANQVAPQSARAVPVTVEDQASHTQPADQPQQSETNSGPQEDSADQQQSENARRDDEESAPDEGVAVIGGQCGGIPTDLHGLFDWEWQRAVPGPTVAEIEAMDLERFPPRPGGRSDRAVDLKVNFQTACVQLDDGTVQCWGWNPWDQFAPAGRFVQTDSGCGVRPDGSFECWGDAIGGSRSKSEPRAFTQVAASDIHLCGLLPDGSAECCGVGDDGQTEPRPGPFAQLYAGSSATCGIGVDSTIECWGDHRQVDDVPSGRFTDLAVGSYHVCALREDGHIACWGNDTTGENEPPDGVFTQLDVFQSRNCGLRSDNVIECWGDARATTYTPREELVMIGVGQDFICGLSTAGVAECWDGLAEVSGWMAPPAGEFIQVGVDIGYSGPAACAIRTDGEAVCWGYVFADAEIPRGPFERISVGYRHACGIRDDQSIGCWGSEEPSHFVESEAADGLDDVEPKQLDGPFVDVHVSVNQACAVRADGSLECWNLPNARPSYAPPRPPAGTYRQVSTASSILCAVTDSGTVECAPSEWNKFTELQIPVAQVRATGQYVCALLDNGSIVCRSWVDAGIWPSSDRGQTEAPDGRFVQMSGVDGHACAVRVDGAVVCWGLDHLGQASPPPGEFTSVSVGNNVSCGVRAGGEIECWGYDFNHRNPFRQADD